MDFVLAIEDVFSYENRIDGNLSHGLLWRGRKLLVCTDRALRGWLQCLNVSRYINNVILSYHGLDICCVQIGEIHNTVYLKISLFKRHVPRSSVPGNKFSYNQRGFFFISWIVCEWAMEIVTYRVYKMWESACLASTINKWERLLKDFLSVQYTLFCFSKSPLLHRLHSVYGTIYNLGWRKSLWEWVIHRHKIGP